MSWESKSEFLFIHLEKEKWGFAFAKARSVCLLWVVKRKRLLVTVKKELAGIKEKM